MSVLAIFLAQLLDPVRIVIVIALTWFASGQKAKWLYLPVGILIVALVLPAFTGLHGDMEETVITTGFFVNCVIAALVLIAISRFTRKRSD